jgi:ABC-type transport system involved in cytochrome c biogenesis permease subunit
VFSNWPHFEKAPENILPRFLLRTTLDRQGNLPVLFWVRTPCWFLRIAKPLTLWLAAVGAGLLIYGSYAGLMLSPPDYLQGEMVRIMYVHVPAAWLGMAGWSGIAIASIMQLVWRHPLSGIAARAIVLMRMRTMLAVTKAEARMRRMAAS